MDNNDYSFIQNKNKDIIHMYVVENMSMPEIAKETGLSLRWIREILYREGYKNYRKDHPKNKKKYKIVNKEYFMNHSKSDINNKEKDK